jgi:hypothetical protein
MEGLECKNWDEMSVMDILFGRWELAVADDLYLETEVEAILVCRLSRCTGFQGSYTFKVCRLHGAQTFKVRILSLLISVHPYHL